MANQCGRAEEDFLSSPFWNYQICAEVQTDFNCCVGELCIRGGQRKLCGVGSPPALHGSQGLNSGHLAHTANGLPTESSYPPPQFIF